VIGIGKPCFIIAEAGVNHNGDMKLAKELVDAAVLAGVDAVKFQTFKSEDLVTESAQMAEYAKKNTGKEESQLAMLRRLELKNEDFIELKKYCDKKGIMFLSTAHTADAVNVLNPLMPAFKIPSGDATNIPFLAAVAKKKKPMIVSTGMADLKEVALAVATIKKQGNSKIILLHCTTNYPCPLDQVNLRAMLTLGKEFKLPIGYSDHTEGIWVSVMAVVMGATVIEKHFTLDKDMPGPDHKASLDPQELKEMVEKSAR
jgi:N,N'-diacetyllegionaminate synthase